MVDIQILKLAEAISSCDDFISLPAEARALYFHLVFQSRNGHVYAPKATARAFNCKEDSLDILESKCFIKQNIDGSITFVNYMGFYKGD